LAREITTAEAAVIVGRDISVISKKATEVDPSNAAAVRATLAAKRLPGRKLGQVWLFNPEHVQAFARIERPTGRPRKSAA
jgi:hypothetical protein